MAEPFWSYLEEEASCQVDRSFGDSVHIGGHAEDAVRLDTQWVELRHVDHTELGSGASGGSASPGMTGTSSLGEPGRVKLQLAVGRSTSIPWRHIISSWLKNTQYILLDNMCRIELGIRHLITNACHV